MAERKKMVTREKPSVSDAVHCTIGNQTCITTCYFVGAEVYDDCLFYDISGRSLCGSIVYNV